jgi:riboflavin kinase/FMN adenylyltransferase
VLHFDADVAAMPAEAFLAALAAPPANVRLWVVSPRFRFGRNGEGDVARLRAAEGDLGVETIVVPPAMDGDEPVSSTRIRACLREGRVEDAERLLGRPHRISGTVARGRALGRRLGFPTANLVDRDAMVPGEGIYAAWAAWDREIRPAAVHVGRRLTFDDAFTVEAHLCDWEGDLYDRRIDLAFVARLRDDVRFDGAEALVRQIGEDVARVRRELVSPPTTIRIGEACSGTDRSPAGP